MNKIVALFVVFSYVFIGAQEESNALAMRVDSLIMSSYNKGLFSGSVLVQKEGKVIYKRSLGWANIKKQDTLEVQEPMRIASITKTFTAVCVLKLAQEGKIDLHKDINVYLPEIEKTGITIHHLLSHTSGIAYINGFWGGHSRKIKKYQKERGDRRTTNNDILRYFEEHKPKTKSEVGEKYSYSNISYTILASLIERVSNLTYAQYLQQNIFTPFQMEHSFLYLPNDKNTNPEKVLSYKLKRKKYNYIAAYYKYDKNGNLKYSSDKYGDKYICSTVGDMNKFNNALINHKILNKEFLMKMLTPVLLNDGKPHFDKYGYGIYQNIHADSVFYQHGGYLAAYETINMFDLKGNQLVLLMNLESGEYWRLHYAILDMLEGKEKLRTYTGKYTKLSKKKERFKSIFEKKYKINYSPLYD